jgi:hypothetical protein
MTTGLYPRFFWTRHQTIQNSSKAKGLFGVATGFSLVHHGLEEIHREQLLPRAPSGLLVCWVGFHIF